MTTSHDLLAESHQGQSNARMQRLRWAVALGLVLTAVGGGCYWYWMSKELSRTINAAQFAIAVSDWPEAERLSEIWTDRTPHDAEAWIALAEATRHLKKFARTAECLGNVPPTDRRYLKILELRGDLLLSELGQPLTAIENWQQMLKAKPNHSIAHQRLIFVFALTQQRTKLVAQIHDAIQRQCEPIDAYIYLLLASNLRFSDGYLRTTEWRKAHPDDPALEIAQAIYAMRFPPSKSLEQFGEKRFVPSEMLDECLRKYPHNLDLLAFVMDRDVTGGDVDVLRRRLSNVPSDSNDDPRIWYYRGWLAMADNQLDDAISAYQTALKLHAYDWKTRHALGTALRLRNRLADAELHAELARQGKELETAFLRLPNTASLGPELAVKLQQYAENCGDHTLSDAVKRRTSTIQPKP